MGDVSVSELLKESGHRGSLSIAMFEEQAALGLQIVLSFPDDNSKVIKTIFPGGQCGPRFESKVTLSEMGVLIADVRWIRDDQVEGLSGITFF